MMILPKRSSMEKRYENYIATHKKNLERTFDKQILPALRHLHMPEKEIIEISHNIRQHDKSKWGADEFVPYLNYYYSGEPKEKYQKEFDIAWKHHQNTNPHHWQYWVMIRDEGKLEPLDMPLKYVVEMVCDWQSVGYKEGNSAYDWYTQTGRKMILSDATRKLVEQLVEHLKEFRR